MVFYPSDDWNLGARRKRSLVSCVLSGLLFFAVLLAPAPVAQTP